MVQEFSFSSTSNFVWFNIMCFPNMSIHVTHLWKRTSTMFTNVRFGLFMNWANMYLKEKKMYIFMSKITADFIIWAEFFYNVKYWNVNYYVKCSSENCWFLVCCFFSVIWIISQIKFFKPKCKLKCQNIFFPCY